MDACLAVLDAWDWLGELINVGFSLQEAEACTGNGGDGRDEGKVFRQDTLEDNTPARTCGNPLCVDFVPIPSAQNADLLVPVRIWAVLEG